MPIPSGYRLVHKEIVKATHKSDLTPVKIKIKVPPSKYELHVSGVREIEGYNDFKMVLKRDGVEVDGYTFIVGRDVASGRTPYTGMAKISQRIASDTRNREALGMKQSNIEGGNGKVIHAGRGTHRHITLGCIRMNESDFTKLFDYLEQINKNEIDQWFWFKNVYINAEPIVSKPDPNFRVPLTGNQQ